MLEKESKNKFKKQYFFSLIFTDVDRFEFEEEIRDFYFPIIKHSIGQHREIFPSLGKVLDPKLNFFKSKNGKKCMATLYGYERQFDVPYDDTFEEGQYFWLMIIDLLLGFVETMRRSHDYNFTLHAYGMADDERRYGWILNSTGEEITTSEIYNLFPKEFITF